MGHRRHSENARGHAATGCAAAATNVTHPSIAARTVTDQVVLIRGRVFGEACRQTQPLATPGTADAAKIAQTIQEGSARIHGVSQAAAERMATTGRTLTSLSQGANPCGKAAEVVVSSDYLALHAGNDPGIVNPPKYIAKNVHDIRLAPDGASCKDLIFAFDKTGTPEVIWKYNGQAKTGGAQYVTDTLVEMANTKGYGKVAYVDHRYVNPDGTPRVAEGAFTEKQARRLQEAKVRLRGIRNLEQRAGLLLEDIKANAADGLDPVAREQLQQLRDDIAASYGARGTLGRIGGGAAMAAASAAVVSLVVQLATDGKVDAKVVGKAAGASALFGGIGAAADTGLYHLGTRVLDLTPEVAKEFARNGVAVGFCLLAVGTDLVAEIGAARRGEVTVMGAMAGTAAKSALDVMPLLLAPLGLIGVPLLVGTQVGGRWLIGKAREADRVLEAAIAEDRRLVDELLERVNAFDQQAADVLADCAQSTELFNRVMGGNAPHRAKLALRAVTR